MIELLVGMAIMSVVIAGFAMLLRFSTTTTNQAMNQGLAQEDVRMGLTRVEEALVHVNEVRVASATFVEFVCDIDHRPDYDPNVDWDADGIPNFRDGDRDADANALLPAPSQWRAGFNLKDDDENGDMKVDVLRRLYLDQSTLILDTSLDEEGWGLRRLTLMTNVSTFTLAYFGSKANSLGKNIDLGNDGVAATGDPGENDGVVSSREMDMTPAPSGMGNRNGGLDLANERRYITELRLTVGIDRNRDGKTDYQVETDVYPPLLPLKSR